MENSEAGSELKALRALAAAADIADTAWDRVVTVPGDKVRMVAGRLTVPANHVRSVQVSDIEIENVDILGVYQRALIIRGEETKSRDVVAG